MNISVDDIKKLREETSAGIADCRLALSEAKGDYQKAKEWLKSKGLEESAKKADREVRAGLIEVYSHGGKVGVLVELLCETDFVARTADFKTLAHDIALQVASMNPESVTDLLNQEFIKDSSVTIDQLVKAEIGKLGENIQIGRFERIALGE